MCKVLDPEAITLGLPIIPGVNNEDAFFVWVHKLAKELGITKTRLLPYHEYGRAKYHILGRTYLCNTQPDIENSQYQYFANILRSGGLSCEIVGQSS